MDHFRQFYTLSTNLLVLIYLTIYISFMYTFINLSKILNDGYLGSHIEEERS